MAKNNTDTAQDFVGKIKAFRDLEFINIKNPEHIVNLIAEQQFFELSKSDTASEAMIDGMKSLLTAAN